MPESTDAMVTVRDGSRIAVDIRGSGTPVLLIPGLGYGTWSWCRQSDQLGADHSVIMVNNRGVAGSSPPSEPFTIETMAQDAADVLCALDAAPAHVVGSSMGGYIGLALAVARPELVRSLTLVASSVGGEDSVRVPESTVAQWMAATDLAPDEYARQTMPLSFRPGWTRENPEQLDELLKLRLQCPTSRSAWQAQFAACEEFLDQGVAAECVNCPVLVVHGTEDRIVPFGNMRASLRRMPYAQTHEFPGAGHLCWIEEAGSFNAVLLDFLHSTQTRQES